LPESEAALELVYLCPATEPVNLLERNSRLARKATSAIERPDFGVFVREVWPGGRRIRCTVTADTSIRILKEQIRSYNGIAVEKQMLLHRGRVLQNELTANFYNMETGDSLDLAISGGARPVPTLPPPQAAATGDSTRAEAAAPALPAGPKPGFVRKAAPEVEQGDDTFVDLPSAGDSSAARGGLRHLL